MQTQTRHRRPEKPTAPESHGRRHLTEKKTIGQIETWMSTAIEISHKDHGQCRMAEPETKSRKDTTNQTDTTRKTKDQTRSNKRSKEMGGRQTTTEATGKPRRTQRHRHDVARDEERRRLQLKCTARATTTARRWDINTEKRYRRQQRRGRTDTQQRTKR